MCVLSAADVIMAYRNGGVAVWPWHSGLLGGSVSNIGSSAYRYGMSGIAIKHHKRQQRNGCQRTFPAGVSCNGGMRRWRMLRHHQRPDSRIARPGVAAPQHDGGGKQHNARKLLQQWPVAAFLTFVYRCGPSLNIASPAALLTSSPRVASRLAAFFGISSNNVAIIIAIINSRAQCSGGIIARARVTLVALHVMKREGKAGVALIGGNGISVKSGIIGV